MRRFTNRATRPKKLVLIGVAIGLFLGGALWWLWRSSTEGGGLEPGRGYWTTPLPEDAPVDPRSDEFIRWLASDNNPDHIILAGVSASGRFGLPIFRSGAGDPTHSIENNCRFVQPPEFRSVRIPREAQPDDTYDAEMTVYDVEKGIVYGLFRTSYSEEEDEWQACGGTVYYLDSNGLDGALPQADEPRNFGHRGLPPYVHAVRHDEIKEGLIDHVLKVAVNTANGNHVFPLTGSDGNSNDPLAPPEGARMRLKPEVDLSDMELTRAERIIAVALQRYGAIIGDQSGGGIVLKVENTVAEGRGNVWEGVLHEHSLDEFTLDDFEMIQLGYGP